MKILLFNTLYYPNIIGGAERSVQLLAEDLQLLGHETIVVSIGDNDSIQVNNGVKVYCFHHRNVYWGIKSGDKTLMKKFIWHFIDIFNYRMYHQINHLIKQERPDIIHTNNLAGFSVAPWVVAKLCKINVVHTLRDYNLLCAKSTMFNHGQNCQSRCLSCRMFTTLKKILSNTGYVNKVVGISKDILNRHKRWGYFRSVDGITIFNGISIDRHITEVDEMNSMESGRIRLLYLGRVERAKGVSILLEVIKGMNQVELYLGGRIHDPVIQKMVDDNMYPSNIHFLGFVNPVEAMKSVDAVIVPSMWNEPFGRVVIEAYQQGKPVIASQRGGIPEIVKVGETGFLFEPSEPDSLRSILEEISHRPNILIEMGMKAREFAKEFGQREVSMKYLEVYNTVIKD